MTSIRLSSEIEEKLDMLCKLTKRPKSFYIKEALNQYLEEMEDAYVALDRITTPKREFLNSDEVLVELKKDSV